MIRADAVTRVQRLLGFRSDLETEIIDALKDSQVELEQMAELPWFLKSEMASATTIVDETRIALPTDFIREVDADEEGGLFYYVSTADEDERWVQLEKKELAAAIAAYQDAVGPPVVYSIDDAYVRVRPISDAVYTVKMIYYYKDVVLDTNVENQWLKHAHELIIGKAGQKVAAAARDAAAMQAFVSMESNGMKRLETENVARVEVGRMRTMGGKD